MLKLIKRHVKYFIALVSLTVINACLLSQDPARFDNEILQLNQIPINDSSGVIVFTGSSSIRMWNSLELDCRKNTIINTGFGGSHMSDLLYFRDETILRFNPKKIFIYEGDNDLVGGKKPNDILLTLDTLIHEIRIHNPDAEIYLISAKPSPSRWAYREVYLNLNKLFEKYTSSFDQLHYIDVWESMLDSHGRPDKSLFISDSLHMNAKGYKLWKEIICPFTED